MKNQVLITGGCGFIGSHLTGRLLSMGFPVKVFDYISLYEARNLAEFASHPKFQYVQGDIRSGKDIADAINKDVLCIFHLAAIVGIQNYIEDPINVIDINIIGTRNVLTAAARHGTRLIYTSTSEIFGKNPNVPWKEEDDRVLGPTTVERWAYSSSKAVGEHLVMAYFKKHALPVTITRYFNVYGPKQNPIFVISKNIHRALNGLAPVVYDGGAQTRCFTYINDAVDATVAVFQNDLTIGQIYNIGSNMEATIGEAIKLIIGLTNNESGYEHLRTSEFYGDQYQDINRRIPDVSKIKRDLGWSAGITLQNGISETIAWARKNTWWLSLKT